MTTQYINSFIDVSKLIIFGETTGDNVTENNKRPRLIFSFRDGNPRITVYTGESGPGGVIAFPSDYPTMANIASYIKEIANSEPGNKVSIDSLTTVYDNDNKPTNEKKIVSTLYIGKSKSGIIYLSLIAENKPKIVFPLKTSPYHIYRDTEGNIVPDDVISRRIATNISNIILNMISDVLVRYTEEEYKVKRKPTKVKNAQITNELDDIDISSSTSTIVETSTIDSLNI